MKKVRTFVKVQTYRLYLFTAALLIAGLGIMPFMMAGSANAVTYGQLANRSLTLSSGVPGNSPVKYTFSIKLKSSSQIEGLKFIACTVAVDTYPGNTGSCIPPTGFNVAGGGFANATFSSQSATWTGTTNFATTAGSNDCQTSAVNNNIICANRTDTTSEPAGEQVSITFDNIKNPTTNNYAFYVGVSTYSDNAFTPADLLDFGATASAVTQSLTTTAAVAEVLEFCVGATTVDGVDSNPGDLIANDCSGVSGTTVNIGTLNTSQINISPINTDGGNGNNGVAMVRSNAGNGVGIYYDAIQDTGSNHLGTLRIPGSTCSASAGPGNTPGAPAASGPFTDSCIDAAGTAQNVFGAGSEEFGMTVAGVNSLGTTSYACQYGDTAESVAAGNTCHLEPQTNYLGDGTAGSTETYGTANGFAWDESGASTIIASSAANAVPQVDDEALIVKFAATPAITTPFGSYSVKTDFTAVPTY